jgi:hypothetical protein
MVGLLAALWGGLLRLPWELPNLLPALALLHGPLMVCGFLGTVIGLERAVGLRARWAYAGPGLTGLGVIAVLAGPAPAAALFTAGSAVLAALFAVLIRRQTTLFTAVMGVGALCWLVGNVLWLAGRPIVDAVPWWAGFLLLTIAGERLELTRLLPRSAEAPSLFAGAAGALVAGLAIWLAHPQLGARVFGAGALALALWLARYDVARQTVRQRGLPRFTAVCLLAGYAWLAAGGLLALLGPAPAAGWRYDAQWHALFLGFVVSMIFGHAPIIFPAVLLRPMAYAPRFYGHLLLLHAALLLRIGGDLAESLAARRWGGLLNAVAIVLFLANTVGALVQAGRSPAQAK